MTAAHPQLLVQSTFAVAPAIREPAGLPLSRVPVRPEDIAPTLDANRQA